MQRGITDSVIQSIFESSKTRFLRQAIGVMVSSACQLDSSIGAESGQSKASRSEDCSRCINAIGF